MTVAENIKNTIISDLAKITTANGYDITIQEIKDKATLITEVTKYPSAFVLLGTDKIGEELEENEIRYLDTIIGVHCNIDDDDKIIGSLLKHFQQDISIIDDYWTSLDTIAGIINLSVVEKDYNINWHNNKKTVGILLTVKYYQELRTVSSGVNPITPPSILSAYSLTSHTHTLINNDLEVNGKLTGKELRAGSDLSPATSGKIYLFDALADEYAQVMEQGDTKLILGVSAEALDINSSKVVINSSLTSGDLYIFDTSNDDGVSNIYMFDSPNAEYKTALLQGDGELYLSNTGNELRILSKDSDNANIYLNNTPITELFSATGHTHTYLPNTLTIEEGLTVGNGISVTGNINTTDADITIGKKLVNAVESDGYELTNINILQATEIRGDNFEYLVLNSSYGDISNLFNGQNMVSYDLGYNEYSTHLEVTATYDNSNTILENIDGFWTDEYPYLYVKNENNSYIAGDMYLPNTAKLSLESYYGDISMLFDGNTLVLYDENLNKLDTVYNVYAEYSETTLLTNENDWWITGIKYLVNEDYNDITGDVYIPIKNTKLKINDIPFYVDKDNNCIIGTDALSSNTTGINNIAIGNEALKNNTYGGNNIALGVSTLTNNTSAFNNIGIGNYSLKNNISGNNNIAIGDSCLQNNTTNNLIAMGYAALQNITTGTHNIAFGTYAMRSNQTGAYNLGIGNYTLYNNKTSHNIAMGYESMYYNDSGIGNIGVGYRTLYSNISGGENIALGFNALYNNTIGAQNMAIGKQSLLSNKVGNQNVAIGYQAMLTSVSGSYNVGIGDQSLYFLTNANSNVGIGRLAGAYDRNSNQVNTLTGSVAIGVESKFYASGDTNEIVIGYQTVGNGSNTVTIGNNSITATILKGNLITNGLTGWSGTITASQVFTVTNGIITSVL